MPSYNIQDGNSGFKRFKTVGEGTEANPYVPVVGINVVPDVDSTTGWTSPLSDTNVVSEKLIKETIDGQEITGASYDSNTGDLTLNKTDGNIIVNIPLSSNNTYVTSASFNTSDGVLTLTLNDSSTVTVDLDGRYLENIIEDLTPQLGGNLDLNSQDITGTGNIDITGEVTATTLIGNMRGATIFQAKAGEALTKGDPVYISGDDITGNKPIVSIADCDDANKMPCFGLANETVSINANVNVVTFGTITGLDTSSFSQGDILYISTTGTLTATKPIGESSLIQNIGKVMRSHASAGSIKVGGAGRTNDVPNLNDGNVFIGNASNQAETRGLTLDDIAETATNKHFTASDETKLGHISVTQAVDLDTMESDIATNNAKVSNATHTGDVTGSTALTISDEAVTNAKMVHVATGTVKGRTSAGLGDVEDLDIDTTLKTALGLVKADVGLSNVENINVQNSFTQNSGQYIATEGIRARDIGGIALLNNSGTAGVTVSDAGVVDIIIKLLASEIRARNANGLKLYNDGGSGIFVADDGKVGIGNNSPAQNVSIGPTLGASIQSFGLGVEGSVVTGSEDNNSIIGIQNWGSGSKLFAYNYSTNVGVPIYIQPDNANVFLVHNGGNVGIGNATPSEKLDVSGNATISGKLGIGKVATDTTILDMERSETSGGGLSIRLKNTNTDTSNNGRSHASLVLEGNNGAVQAQYFADGFGGTAYLRTYTNHPISIGTNQEERMLITNVGDIVARNRIYADDGLHVRGDWLRVNGDRGVYFESHGGGWFMQDSTYIRAYNNKVIYTNNDIRGNRFVDNHNTSRYIDASGTSELGHIVLDEHIKVRRNSGFRTGTHNWMRYYGYAYGTYGGGYSTVNGAMDIHVPHGWGSDDLIMRFNIHGGGTKNTYIYGSLNVTGAVAKGSGSFDIAHPDPAKKDTHRLRHYFVETPSAGGNIYKYQLECREGENYIDLPDYFEHLNKDSLVWANPFKHFGRAWGEVIEGGKRAKIVVEQSGIYNILIFGDRKDAIAMQEFEKYGVEYKNKEQ